MPNASATGSLIVAAPSGSYGTGTPQRPLTIVSGSFTNSAAVFGEQIVDPPSGTHSLRVFEAAMDLPLTKEGLERVTGVLSLLGVYHIGVGVYDSLSSYDQMTHDIIATVSTAGSLYLTGNAQYGQGYCFYNNQVCKWSQGVMLGPGKGLYIFTSSAFATTPYPVNYRVIYDVP